MKNLFYRSAISIVLSAACVLLGQASPGKPEEALVRSSQSLGRLVYVQQGDLYVRELPAGTPRRVTNDGRNKEPQWSPSGNWIIYKQRGDFLVIRRDGSGSHPLSSGESWQFPFSFSTRTEEIAIITDKGALAIAPLAGGNARTVATPRESGRFIGVAWSPDGRSLAYTEEHSDGMTRVWQRSADGNGKPQLLYTSRKNERVPVLYGYSSGGRHLLFWALNLFPAASINQDGVPLFAVNLAQGAVKAYPLFGREYENFVLTRPDFIDCAPQGSRVAISVGGDRYLTHNKSIAIVDLAKRSIHRATPSTITAVCPAWSPDGKRIAYLAAPAREPDSQSITALQKQVRLWVMDANGTHQKRLEIDHLADFVRPAWLGDSRTLLFARAEKGSKIAGVWQKAQSLWTVGADGKGLRCIVPRRETGQGNGFDVWTTKRARTNSPQ